MMGRSEQAAASAASPQGLPVNGGLRAAVASAVSVPIAAPAPAAPAPVVATPTPAKPVPVTSPPTPAPVVTGGAGGVWAALRQSESSGNYALNTGNGYYGAYQFSASTWSRLGGSGLASSASPAAQDAAAYKLYQSSGWSSWPVCSAAAGL